MANGEGCPAPRWCLLAKSLILASALEIVALFLAATGGATPPPIWGLLCCHRLPERCRRQQNVCQLTHFPVYRFVASSIASLLAMQAAASGSSADKVVFGRMRGLLGSGQPLAASYLQRCAIGTRRRDR